MGEDTIVPQAQVIPEPGSLIGDLLSMDLGGGAAGAAAGAAGGNVDLLAGGDILGGAAPAAAPPSTNALLGDIFGLGNAASTTFYIPPKQEWLSAAKGNFFRGKLLLELWATTFLPD